MHRQNQFNIANEHQTSASKIRTSLHECVTPYSQAAGLPPIVGGYIRDSANLLNPENQFGAAKALLGDEQVCSCMIMCVRVHEEGEGGGELVPSSHLNLRFSRSALQRFERALALALALALAPALALALALFSTAACR